MERLQKVISDNGYTSRRKAEELIKEGKVLVNGEVATIGLKVNPSDEIIIDGNILAKDIDSKVYYLLNKPRGVVTTASDEKGRKTVIDIIETDKRIYPVGRLDYDTTGALLLTNDGELTNKLKNGVKIDNYKTSKCRVKLKSYDKKTQTSLVELTIHEGHNHQVKKMFESVGYDVIKFTRVRFAFLDVKSLKSGEYRSLLPHEVKKLYSLVK